jgi:hypothetical protein
MCEELGGVGLIILCLFQLLYIKLHAQMYEELEVSWEELDVKTNLIYIINYLLRCMRSLKCDGRILM